MIFFIGESVAELPLGVKPKFRQFDIYLRGDDAHSCEVQYRRRSCE